MVVLTMAPPATNNPPPKPDSAPFSANVLLMMATADDSEWRPPPLLPPAWLSTIVVPMIVACGVAIAISRVVSDEPRAGRVGPSTRRQRPVDRVQVS